RASVEHRGECLLFDAEEVRGEDLDIGCGELPPERANRRRVVSCTSVREVVAVHGGDDDVQKPHLRGGLGEAERLERVGRRVGLSGADVEVAAGTGADVAEDLEGGRSATPALPDVRAPRLLADRVQLPFVDEALDLEVAR